MKAVILLGTLKTDGLSNTRTLSGFLQARLEAHGVECTIISLVEHAIPPGTCSDMGAGDDWPRLLEQVLASDMVIFATPIWWSSHSSLIQRIIERLDELHDLVLDGDPSPLEGKVGGIVITGDSDGAQQVIGNIANFFNAVGLLLPPYATLSVLWDRQAKGREPTRRELMAKYEADYGQTADRMVAQLRRFAAAEGASRPE